jgi:uncharacterized membrane protein
MLMLQLSSVTVLHSIVLVCCTALLVLFTLPLLLIENASYGLWLMQAVPLLLTLPGLIRFKSRNLQWLGFLVLFYLLEGILQIYSALILLQITGVLTTLVCFVLFIAVIVKIRTETPHRLKD